MLKSNDLKQPLLLACCGCANSAHIASDIARVMENEGFAQQISGALNVIQPEPDWISQVRHGRPLMLIDGCAKCCTQHLLETLNLTPSWYINLFDFGLPPCSAGLHHVAQLNLVMRRVQGILSSQHYE